MIKHLNQLELGRRWSVSPRTLERWRWTGDGPRYIKLKGRVAYREADVEAYEAERLTILQIVTELDRGALAAYCQSYGRWVEAERKLHETPMLIKLPSGYVQQNPWLTIANKQLELMHKYLTEFGLSPATRSRVSAGQSLGKGSKFDGLLGPLPPDQFFDD